MYLVSDNHMEDYNMKINDIQKKDNFYFLSGNETDKNSAYYSFLIGIEAYLKTYSTVAMSLSEYMDEEEYINCAAQENDKYIECFINIAIHIQHFFELEIKKILENEHVLFSVDAKGDPIITYKLLHNEELKFEDTEKLKSIEFSDALNRLTKLVNNNIIDNEVAKIFVTNKELLSAMNFLRNTTLHRGRRFMKYCFLDMLFAQNLLPLIKEILEKTYYIQYKKFLVDCGVYEIIDKIILEGNKSNLDYSQIALLKEIGRCKLELVSKPKLDEIRDKEYIEKIIEKKIFYNCDDAIKTSQRCPCCQYNTVFVGREFMGYDIDELGDEMGNGAGFQIIHVPNFEEYHECAWCGFKVSSFIDF